MMPSLLLSDYVHPQKRTSTPPGATPSETEVPKAVTSASRILVVEDEFFVSLEIEAALTGAGFHVVGLATTADEAERYANEHKPDLVVMDIRLAGKRDGVDAAREIYQRSGIRSIFATAHADAHTRERAAEACPLAWLPKPYSMQSLLDVIRQALKDLKN